LSYESISGTFGDELRQRNRGRLYWYNPYVPVRTKEIWPNQQTSLRAGNETTDVMVLKYKSMAHQEQINKDSIWVGITTSLYSGDYEQTQSKFFEIWLKGSSGRLHLGTSSIGFLNFSGFGRAATVAARIFSLSITLSRSNFLFVLMAAASNFSCLSLLTAS